MSMEKFLRDIEARLASERAWDMELDAGDLAGVLFHIPGAFGGEARLNVS